MVYFVRKLFCLNPFW